MVKVLFDISLDLGGPDTADYLHLDDPVYGLLNTGQLGPDVLFTNDLQTRLLSHTVTRPSSRVVGPIVTYEAGTCSFTLLNDDGVLDPFTLSESPVMTAIRLRAVFDGITYPVFRGFVKMWAAEHRSPTHAVVNATAVDGFSLLADYPRTAVGAVGAGEDTGARLDRILGSVNWSPADRDIAVGDSTLAATTLEGDALEEAQKVMRTEAGEFYVDERGFMFFRNRHAQLTDTRSSVSQATFGSDVAGGEIPYVGVPGVTDDDQQLVNLVTATRVGGAEQTASDAASRARYLDHKHDEPDMLLQSDAAVADWAGYVLHFDRLPEFRFTSLNLDMRLNPAVMAPQILGRRIGDRITVVRRPPADPWGTIEDTRDCYIRSITHTWTRPDKWQTVWGLQPVDKTSYLVLDHATLGKLDNNALSF